MPAMNTIAGNLFLIGLMGAGKTTLGKQLAQRLNRCFFDSDHEICQRTGVSIPTIFELEGEQGFRDRESNVINELTHMENIVLATGGGAVLRPENQSFLKKRGTVIYLHASPEVLLKRTQHDTNRPLLQVDNPLAKLQELYNARDHIYRSLADVVVESDQPNCYKTLEHLLNILPQSK
ncbi:shikimate kinase [Neisseria weaveri]|uniref:Shikimate kinase n=1 Tax=Neisseria weaveri TaxID=28091 RepID=A0A448VJL7_9NEIS|nr:shikimate kinase [Neisseria weaveri]EGV35345.1 shikimate kinase [Neisseria weaveri LMG 5135]EGV35879.1 shikimate kinase [Neisseria weaveri ATCC 51223]VEJ49952.1 shikimate kinase [Neisseria weaveri]